MDWIYDPFLEKKQFKWAVVQSVFLCLLLIIIFLINNSLSYGLNQYGILPRQISGLTGIFASIFLHADWNHLWSNMFPFTLFCFGLFYYFQDHSYQILIYNWLFSGFLTWCIGREGTHIGASGLIYALGFFLFLVSVLKKEKHLMAFTLVIVFLYGSMIWGFFPQLFPDKHISWEGHLSGALTGIFAAFLFRNKGIERPVIEEEEEQEVNAGINTVFLLLGSNLENRSEHLQKARLLIEERVGQMVKKSSVYESESWGFESYYFYNQALILKTTMSAAEILEITQNIEKKMGRSEVHKTGTHYSDRTIDIDILFFNEEIIETDTLTVPHPRISERKFVLLPLVEIAPEWKHPQEGKTVKELLENCKDSLAVFKI